MDRGGIFDIICIVVIGDDFLHGYPHRIKDQTVFDYGTCFDFIYFQNSLKGLRETPVLSRKYKWYNCCCTFDTVLTKNEKFLICKIMAYINVMKNHLHHEKL